jgi:UDP-3-O-[3-hydroxymyristoyl] glucosamine N-acyltransferase
MGRACRISPGVVIGASGFGYAPDGDRWHKIHQLGGVIIGDEVEIGANTTIDRGALDDTVIGDRVKMDNLIQIAHNVRIGDDTIMAACTGVAGSAVIGRRCKIGGRVSINGHITIADDVVLHTCSFIARSIDEPDTWSAAIPAQPAARWRRIVASMNRLVERRGKPSGRG